MARSTDGLTFQFAPEEPRGLGVGAAGAAPRLGITGGNSSFGVQEYANTQAIGSSELPDFIARMFEPKLEAAKQQKFWQGFTAARSGKTQQEIADEQPWYTGIFGPTDYELGAQTYAVQKAAADMESTFLERLPQLRELPPEALGDELNAIASSLLTGNVYADALIQKALMERGGVLISAHAKARAEWQQQELSRTRYDAWTAASAAYHAGTIAEARLGKDHPGQAPTAEELRERRLQLIQSFEAGEFENPDAWRKDFITFVSGAAESGHWATIQAIQETGLLGALHPEEQQKVEAALEVSRARFKQRMAADPQLFRPIMELQIRARAGAVSAEETEAAMREVDALYTALTGDTKGYFDMGDYIGTTGSAEAAMYNAWEAAHRSNQAAAKAAETEEAKQAAAAREQAQAALMVNTGSAGDLASLEGWSKEKVDRVFMTLLNAKTDPSGPWRPANLGELAVSNMAASVSGKRPYFSQGLSDMLRQQVRSSAGENWTEGFEVAYQNWRSMMDYSPTEGDTTSGRSAAMQYFGEYHESMEAYDQLRRAGVNPEVAYRQAFGQQVTWRFDTLPGEKRATVQAELTAVVESLNPGWWELGREALGGPAQNVVLQAMLPHFARLRNMAFVSPEEAAKQALQMARADGLEVSGMYAWQNARGQKSLSEYAGMEAGVFEEYFDEVITGRFRAQGISVGPESSITLVRVPDGKEGPRMIGVAYHEGKQVTIAITGEDIMEAKRRRDERGINRSKMSIFERIDAGEGGFGAAVPLR